RYGLPALAAALAVACAVDQEVADAGHLIAQLLGALAARSPWLRRRAVRTPARAVPARTHRTPTG
ncbi:hypothetical protein AB0O00_34445, partial [Kitasatospora sp. NPDC093558]